jgi:hypothetical protein
MSSRKAHLAVAEVVHSQGSNDARKLYKLFHIYNETYFDDRLAAPLILITQASSNRTLGDYIPQDVHGFESRIRISPSVLKRGGMIFAKDVLLHEMIHGWSHEVRCEPETEYKGHGPVFANRCNRIGKKLGLNPVGVKGESTLPNCAYWPMNVRPKSYYPFIFDEPKRKPGPKPSDRELKEDTPEHVWSRLSHVMGKIDTVTLRILGIALDRELDGRSR